VAKVKAQDDEAKLPGTVFSARQVRILRIAVIAMGILLVGGFAFVLAAIVYQASRPKQDLLVPMPAAETGAAPTIELPMGRGQALTAISLDGSRLAFHLNGVDGPEIVVVDLASGKLIARVKLKPQ
jgi:hypothetical protein